jgi:hypothetical protein
MAMIDINWDPSRRELRQFGGLCILFFGGLSAWAWFGHESSLWATVAGTAAVVLGGLGLAAPGLLRWVFVSHILMAIIYFGLITPIGLVMRAVGYDPMEREFDRQATTYWKKHEQSQDVGRYFRQF